MVIQTIRLFNGFFLTNLFVMNFFCVISQQKTTKSRETSQHAKGLFFLYSLIGLVQCASALSVSFVSSVYIF